MPNADPTLHFSIVLDKASNDNVGPFWPTTVDIILPANVVRIASFLRYQCGIYKLAERQLDLWACLRLETKGAPYYSMGRPSCGIGVSGSWEEPLIWRRPDAPPMGGGSRHLFVVLTINGPWKDTGRRTTIT